MAPYRDRYRLLIMRNWLMDYLVEHLPDSAIHLLQMFIVSRYFRSSMSLRVLRSTLPFGNRSYDGPVFDFFLKGTGRQKRNRRSEKAHVKHSTFEFESNKIPKMSLRWRIFCFINSKKYYFLYHDFFEFKSDNLQFTAQ